ncbi:MAG: hypothetical protein HOW73_50915 [Polyangiaceae bacterium]|nr:hypothetical protein [Polyangiaceae bacterium]
MQTLRLVGSAHLALLVLLSACGDSSSGGGGSGGSSDGGDGQGANADGGNGATTNDGGNGASTSDGGNGSGGGLSECNDPGLNVPIGACDLYLQNCPVATDTCDVGDADPKNSAFEPTTVCVTQNGLKAIGESCNSSPDCAAHLTCVGNTCTPFCCPGDATSCGSGDCSVEVQLLDQDEQPTGYTFMACSFAASCDLFTPDSCPPDENCYLQTGPITACYTGDDLADGAPCMYLNDCQDSAICIGGEEDAVCRFLCQADAAPGTEPGLGGCPDGQLCDTNSFDSGIAGVGFCHP